MQSSDLDSLGIVCISPAMKEIYAKAEDYPTWPRWMHILIYGETGTGKDVFARYLHSRLPQSDVSSVCPFVTLNCGDLSGDLIASELFGHRKGAFTGATENRKGKIRIANGGVVFLDQLESMPETSQVRLLHTLESGKVTPLGDDYEYPVEVRFIAAINQDPHMLIEKGQLRDDLYYRLSKYEFSIPPLCDRPEEIIPMANFFAKQMNVNLKLQFSAEARDLLENHNWPGNVRQLSSVIHRAVIDSKGQVICPEHLHFNIEKRSHQTSMQSIISRLLGTKPIDELTDDFCALLFQQAMNNTGGNRTEAATILGLNRTTFVYRLNQLKRLWSEGYSFSLNSQRDEPEIGEFH